MMLRAYLWKEWREQRSTFVAIAGSMAALAGTAWLTMSGWFGTANSCPALCMFVALLLGLVLVVGELMPGEMRRGQVDFLRRLPGGVAMPIVAKLVTAAATVVLCVVCALLSSWWLQGSENFVGSMAGSWDELGQGLLLAAAVGAWCLAVSAWLPRGTLSLPGTILFWLGSGLPVVFLVSWSRGLAETLLRSTDRVVAQWLLLAAGLPIAVHAMRSVLRFRHDPWGRFRSAVLAVAAFTPFWGWTAVRVWQWHVADPAAPGFTIHDGYLGSGGRFAFLNAQATRLWPVDPSAANSLRWPRHALVVDLTTGEWRQLGGASQRIDSPSRIAGKGLMPEPHMPLDWLVASRDWLSGMQVLDGATGVERGNLTAEHLQLEAQRVTNPFRLPDARRAWFEGDQLKVEGAAGGVDTLAWGRGDVPANVAGLGIRFFRRSEGGHSEWYYDLARRRAFRIPGKEAPSNVVVLPGRWLLWRRLPKPELSWFDPDTGQVTPAAEELRFCRPLGLARDGRILLASQRVGEPFLLSLLDPEAAMLTPVPAVDGPGGLPEYLDLKGCTPAGDPVFACFRGIDWWFAVLRDGVLRSTAVLNDIRILALLDEDSVIVIVRERTIERLWWDSTRRELLWPRPVGQPAAAPPR